ncbi:MAG: formyltransferase family protein [Candidatus Diapherotrites archaeon]|nr:formyltransferase family protein [Candidatus Diapherotrites archaeon]
MTFQIVVLGTRGKNTIAKLAEFLKTKNSKLMIKKIIANKEDEFFFSARKVFHGTKLVKNSNYSSRKKFEQALLKEIGKVDLVLLLHFSRRLTNFFLKEIGCPVVNLHPSLLPKHSKLFYYKVFESVLHAHEKVSGVTLHLVDAELDHGKILMQKKFKLSKKENLESLIRKTEKVEFELLKNFLNSGISQL